MILDIIYPPKCVVCKTPADASHLCPKCRSNINILSKDVRAEVQYSYERLWSLAAYEGVWLEVIHNFKYGRANIADKIVERFLNEQLKDFADVDAVVPVPLSHRRYLLRGYNQSMLIAKFVSKIVSKPILKRAIIKKKHTPQQIGLSKDDRMRNLKGAFKLPRFMADNVQDKHILLVDDVVTTGATIEECARLLGRAGAARVDVLTLAKTL